MGLRIFISYSHKDEEQKINFEKHFSTIQTNNEIILWSDREIYTGSNWEEAITKELNNTDIFILLISANYFYSKFCQFEMETALSQFEKNRAYLVPVIISPVLWGVTQIGKLQALPTDAIPITSWENKDEAWVNVMEGISNLLSDAQFIRQFKLGAWSKTASKPNSNVNIDHFSILLYVNIKVTSEEIKQILKDVKDYLKNRNESLDVNTIGFTIGFNNIDEAYEIANQLFEYFLYYDWICKGIKFPPTIEIIINECNLEIPSYECEKSIQPINIFISTVLYQQLVESIQKKFYSIDKNYYMFNPVTQFGNVLRDHHYYKRGIIIRRFSFLWLLLDQLPCGSWGKSLPSWMDAVWSEILGYSSNDIMDEQGGYETTILNLDLLIDIIGTEKLIESKIWIKYARQYFEFTFNGSGFGPYYFMREGYGQHVSIRHTALATYLFAKIILSIPNYHPEYVNYFVSGLNKLFIEEMETSPIWGNSIKIDARNPVIQYFLSHKILNLIDTSSIADILSNHNIDVEKIKVNWLRSKQKLENVVLVYEYESDDNSKRRFLGELIQPYVGFSKMETYTLLTSIMFIEDNISINIKNRFRAALEFIVQDYLKHSGDIKNRYSFDALRPSINGIKARYSDTQENNEIDLGCTSLMLRVLRSKKVIKILWEKRIPEWLPKIRFFLNEDLLLLFDRFCVNPELFRLTNAGMFFAHIVEDNKHCLNEILKKQKTYINNTLIHLNSENQIIRLLDEMQSDCKTQISSFSLLSLILDKRPEIYIDKMNCELYYEFKSINEPSRKKNFLTSIAYSNAVEKFNEAHIQKSQKKREKIFNHLYKTLISFLSKSKIDEILDAGCGLGDFSYFLSNKGYTVTGIDISEQMIKSAKINYQNENLEFILMDMNDIPISWENKFNAIISTAAFQHLSMENAINILTNFHRSLNDFGCLKIDIQIGRESGFDPDLRYIESYANKEDVIKKLKFKKIGFEVLQMNEWKLKRGNNAYNRPIEFNFMEFWLRKV